MELEREYYEHDGGCPAKDFTDRGRNLKSCNDCAGIFDATTGKGVATTDRRFDENYDEWKAHEHPEVEE